MSNRIGKLVKDIQYLTDFTIDQVAERVGYSRPHLNRLMKEGDSKKLYEALQTKFAKELQNVTIPAGNTPVNSLQPRSGQNSQKTSKDTDILTTVTTKPDYGMRLANGTNGKDHTISLLVSNETKLIDTNKNQQETIGKLTDLVTKLVEKK